MSMKYFHFTLGPVQSFVAQARRTRDFWAGSFLLSWLSSVAIQSVICQGGDVQFPIPDADYLAWLTQGKGEKPAPPQGCIPNRFKGFWAKVPEDFKPQLVGECVHVAWKALAEKVWEQDFSKIVGNDSETRKIWDRQIGNFWEISWALTDSESESNLLDRRKNWRTSMPPEEAGVKCMMMDGWQELSGIATPNAEGLKAFWDNLRKPGTTLATDLREHEYLCAIAYVKRRFAHYFEDIKAATTGGWVAHGWPVSPSVPSVAYMAAAPWLAQVLRSAPKTELEYFHKEAKALARGYGEYHTRLDCIDKALNKRKDDQLGWDIKSLDGNVFFEASLDNKNIFPDQTQAQKVKAALINLRKAIKDKDIGPVSTFYAVLLMDGDSLGSQMSDSDKQKNISAGLNRFTNGVKAIVEQQSGFLVYAGGDDVLALLPLEYALECARLLREHYLQCFEAWPDIKTTISAAIEYAHIKIPLGKVLGDAHCLLDYIAKEQTGRDAIAVKVWKPGGRHLQWAMPWERATDKDHVIIDRLAQDFQKIEQETPFSNQFFFHINERFAMLQSKNAQGELKAVFDLEVIERLIAAEYLNSGVNVNRKPKLTLNKAIAKISPLLSQCFPVKRFLDVKGDPYYSKPQFLSTDAAQLVRFLAQKGVDHG